VKRYDDFLAALKKRLPARHIALAARGVQFVRRLRTIRASLFVWAVVLSRLSPGRPGFAEARQWYARLGGARVWPRPFQKRFLFESTVQLFARAFESAVAQWRTQDRVIRHPLARLFPDIVIWDSTLVQVSNALARIFPGTRRSKAALKISLAISAFGLLPLCARVGRGSQHDAQIFPGLGGFRPGTLWLFDKGYVAYERLRDICEAGQYFLCPMRSNGVARVMAVREGSARVRALLKRPADERVLRLGASIRGSWDLDVQVRPSPQWAIDPSPVTVRLVLLPGPRGEPRPYLTNLPPERWPPRVVGELYRLRWQVELVFKELKQHLNLESMPSGNEYAVQVFAWASLIALAVSRTIAAAIQPLARLVGLAAPIRPMLVSRSLRATARLLAEMFTAPSCQRPLIVRLLFAQIERDVRTREIEREDSFHRLRRALPLAA